jgi:hypothetical protein
MRWAYRRNNWIIGFIIFGSGMVTSFVAVPLWKEAIMQLSHQQYATHVRNCDQAMREHFLAKMKVVHNPGEESVSSLEATEVGLFACQDYDIFQKKLLQWGLSESELSQMRLIAIEAGAVSMREIVSQHEFRY